jgi:hypothetical protein
MAFWNSSGCDFLKEVRFRRCEEPSPEWTADYITAPPFPCPCRASTVSKTYRHCRVFENGTRATDTDFQVIPAVRGGDALSDAVAGFFENGVPGWLRHRGIVEPREAVNSPLCRMSGRLFRGSPVVTLAAASGIGPRFG